MALVLGASLGVVGTWFALQPETTVVITGGSPPSRIRPDGTRFKEKVSDELKFDGQVKVVSRSGFDDGNADAASSVDRNYAQEMDQDGQGFQRNAVIDGSSSIRSSEVDQIVDPGIDGAYSKFRRVDSLVIRTDYSADGTRLQSITYRIGPTGYLISYEVLDGLRNKRYRALLGYSKRQGPTFGKLVYEKLFWVGEDRVFDDLEDGGREERAAYYLVHAYNADGTANDPVGIPLRKQADLSTFRSPGGKIVSHAPLAAHIVSALNQSYPIEPPIKP